ncbi:unnamed protein product [Somion occarium]|uniref:Uncharacterized protein n=1 Tax=Somion occarium TaxID=3059160 RepID=A0ABP1CUY6_9APHY
MDSDVLKYIERNVDSDDDDRYDDEKLDKLIVINMSAWQTLKAMYIAKPQLLLLQIVSLDKSLNQAYSDCNNAKSLLNEYSALVPLLAEACETRSFAKVRSLAILQPKPLDVEELWRASNILRVPYEFNIITPEEHASLDEEISAMELGPDPVMFLYNIILTARRRGLNLKPMDYNKTRAYLRSHPALKKIIVELRKARNPSFASLRLIYDFWILEELNQQNLCVWLLRKFTEFKYWEVEARYKLD